MKKGGDNVFAIIGEGSNSGDIPGGSSTKAINIDEFLSQIPDESRIFPSDQDTASINSLFQDISSDEIKDNNITHFFKNFRAENKLTSKRQQKFNFAFFDVDTNEIRGGFFIRNKGHEISERLLNRGLSSLIESRQVGIFTNDNGALMNRIKDSERLGLELLAKWLSPSARGEIRIASELVVCDGCQMAIEDFEALFNNQIKIITISTTLKNKAKPK